MHAYLAVICRDLGADFVHAGGLLIMFTLSPHCRERFLKLK